MKYNAIVIGASAGGINAIKTILMPLKKDFKIPILIVQHISPASDNYMVEHLNNICKLNVKEIDEKEKIRMGNVYIAPSNYHLLVEKNKTLSFTVEPKVNYSRPAIDVLFESAAEVYTNRLIGIILTGANSDGSKGLKKIKELGGLAIVQDPSTAEASLMPNSAIKITKVDYVLTLDEISRKIIKLERNLYEK